MHRQISTTDEPFRSETPLGLYALTAIVGGFLAADLWPLVGNWLKSPSLDVATWEPQLYGYRYALIAAVVGGPSAVDASALAGESLPQDKAVGDSILAGSIAIDGSVTVEAKKIAKQTVAGQVIDLTAAALKDKAPLERQADRLAKYFLPAVLVLALLTFLANVLYQMSG